MRFGLPAEARELQAGVRDVLASACPTDVVRAGWNDQAEPLWRACLESGDSMAHYGLGYTLLALDRPREAYGHLRFYTELSPANAWAWCFLGQACEAIGETAEARAAYARAVELGEETDAPERLNDLEGERR